MGKGSIGRSNALALIEESRELYESLCFKTEKLADLIKSSQRRRRELRRAVAQRQEHIEA